MTEVRTPDLDRIEERLRNVIDPCSAARGIDNNIVDMGLLEDVEIDGRHVTVNMRLTTPACLMVTNFKEQIEEEVGTLQSVDSVHLETDGGHNWRPSMMSDEAQCRRDAYLDRFEPIEPNA